MSTKILAIETSCDETAASVVEDKRQILSNVISSQTDLHKKFGGVVPEIASRSHQELISLVIWEALKRASLKLPQLDALAITQGPGLPGALMVGMATAKAIAYGTGLPLIGINHLEGHLFANYLHFSNLNPPFVALIVSGGHTLLVDVKKWGKYQVLGQTLDDAAGEAFDKIAGFLGLGYPGGPIISSLAEKGNPRAINFPRAMINSGDYNFSLSGLKTSVLYWINKQKARQKEINIPDLCASFQAAVVEVQVKKTIKALEQTGYGTVVLGGGVAANKQLQIQLSESSRKFNFTLFYPPPQLCTDNAAMIAAAAFHHYHNKEFLSLDAEIYPNLALA
jgi:N6-L-threonylcarbamoyladenine synthase